MKCANLYATADRNLATRCAGVYASVYVPGHGYIYVRAELVEVDELVETLDHAQSRDGKSFLNGIPLNTETGVTPR